MDTVRLSLAGPGTTLNHIAIEKAIAIVVAADEWALSRCALQPQCACLQLHLTAPQFHAPAKSQELSGQQQSHAAMRVQQSLLAMERQEG